MYIVVHAEHCAAKRLRLPIGHSLSTLSIGRTRRPNPCPPMSIGVLAPIVRLLMENGTKGPKVTMQYRRCRGSQVPRGSTSTQLIRLNRGKLSPMRARVWPRGASWGGGHPDHGLAHRHKRLC